MYVRGHVTMSLKWNVISLVPRPFIQCVYDSSLHWGWFGSGTETRTRLGHDVLLQYILAILRINIYRDQTTYCL